jgi:hypothetical protein
LVFWASKGETISLERVDADLDMVVLGVKGGQSQQEKSKNEKFHG